MNTHPPKKLPTAINEPQELEQRIRERAYELYEARGREDGHLQEDWFRAKDEITIKRFRTATVLNQTSEQKLEG